MRAAILAVGDELTLGQKTDTNSAWLAERLMAAGILTIEHRTLPDDRGAIAVAVAELAARSDLLLVTGGLGPTDDDLTRVALGDVLAPGRALVRDEGAERRLRRWFEGRRRPMPATNLSQAMRPETMDMVPNPHGTAPGLRGRHGGCVIFAMPGPPREMEPMFVQHVMASLREAAGPEVVLTALVHAYGIGESDAAELLGGMTARDRSPMVGITASAGIITARVRCRDRIEAARAAVIGAAKEIERIWTPYCFGREDPVAAGGTAPKVEATLAAAVGVALRLAGATVATAESCTGGWVGHAIVDVPGASDYYRGGWVTYADDMKTQCLGVPPEMLREHGAVSAPVARAMATGARDRAGAGYAVSTTGIAGGVPAAGSSADSGADSGGGAGGGKQAGLVFIAVAGPGGVVVRRFRFHGDRTVVRDRTVKSALQMLRLRATGVSDDLPMIWEAVETGSGRETGRAGGPGRPAPGGGDP